MSFRSLIHGLALAAALAATASAQCNTPDGLDGGPPCGPATLSALKKSFQQTSLGICWQQCQVDTTASYRALWGPFIDSNSTGVGTDCGWSIARLRLYQGLTLRWAGVFNVHYSRTWLEATPISQFQVWRYLVNGDMRPLTSAPGPCAAPPCAAAYSNRVRFTGYVDFARDCITGQISYAWMVTHACDGIDHDPNHPRGGTFHPDRYYTFLGPAAGFVPGPVATVESGTATLEGVRAWDTFSAPVACRFEEPLVTATFTPMTSYCYCSLGAAAWVESTLAGSGVAGTTFTTPPGQLGFKSVAIGAWTNPLVYPGPEELRWSTSELVWGDACNGLASVEPFFGVTTGGGFFPYQLAGGGFIALPDVFVDQSSSKSPPPFAPVRNVTYRSDHLLHLNL